MSSSPTRRSREQAEAEASSTTAAATTASDATGSIESTKATIASKPETSNADNEDTRRKNKNNNTNNNNNKLPPSVSTTRKGSAFPMRHPANVKLHSNDFEFEDYAKKLEAEKQQKKKLDEDNSNNIKASTDGETNNTAAAAAAVSSSSTQQEANNDNNTQNKVKQDGAVVQQQQQKTAVELEGEAAQEHIARQGEAWDLHYRHTQNNFFPIKNYLAQAFRSVILPLLPPIENPEGCNDFDEAKKSGSNNIDSDSGKKETNDDVDEETSTTTTTVVVENNTNPTTTTTSNNSSTNNVIKPQFIIECGCGTGSALLPLMAAADFHHYAGFDISATAVELFKKHDIVQGLIEKKKERMTKSENTKNEPKNEDDNDDVNNSENNNSFSPLENALPELFVLDAAEEEIPHNLIPKSSADICLLIFVLSALEKPKMSACLKRLAEVMKPGGHLCFRDYGILDNSYFRFQKNGNKTCKGSFVKGDQTQQYFFSLDEVKKLFSEAGFDVAELTYHCNKLTNRKTGVEMHKIIVNGIFRKR